MNYYIRAADYAYARAKLAEAESTSREWTQWRRYRTAEQNDECYKRMQDAMAAYRLINAAASSTLH